MTVIYKEIGTETTEVEVITIDGAESNNSYYDYDDMVADLGESNEYICEE